MADLSSELLGTSLDDLMAEARRLRAGGTGTLVTYSPKVFVPLTTLCRDCLRLLHLRAAAAAR
jgi:FO synthase